MLRWERSELLAACKPWHCFPASAPSSKPGRNVQPWPMAAREDLSGCVCAAPGHSQHHWGHVRQPLKRPEFTDEVPQDALRGGITRGEAPSQHLAALCTLPLGHLLSTSRARGCVCSVLHRVGLRFPGMVANSRAAFKKQTPTVFTFSPSMRVPQALGVYRTASNEQISQPLRCCSQAPKAGMPGSYPAP